MVHGTSTRIAVHQTLSPRVRVWLRETNRGSCRRPLLAQTTSQMHANHPNMLTASIYTYYNYFFPFFLTVESLDENFFNANHFDVTRSKCRQTKPIVWATLLILMSRHADRSSSSLYLADLRSMQYGCKFATVCDRKGYMCRSAAHKILLVL